MSRRYFLWSDMGDCPTCGAVPAQVCHNTRSALPMQMKYPHPDRPEFKSGRVRGVAGKTQDEIAVRRAFEDDEEIAEESGHPRARQNFPLRVRTFKDVTDQVRANSARHTWEPYDWATSGGVIQIKVCSWCSVNWWPGKDEPQVWCPGPPLAHTLT